jgi:hypothetical protein
VRSSMQILLEHNRKEHKKFIEGSVTTGRHPPKEYKILNYEALHTGKEIAKYSDFTFEMLHTVEASLGILPKSKVQP